jgi:hypothetical protein
VKQGAYLSAPITNIRDEMRKRKKTKKLVTRKVKKKDLENSTDAALESSR